MSRRSPAKRPSPLRRGRRCVEHSKPPIQKLWKIEPFARGGESPVLSKAEVIVIRYASLRLCAFAREYFLRQGLRSLSLFRLSASAGEVIPLRACACIFNGDVRVE